MATQVASGLSTSSSLVQKLYKLNWMLVYYVAVLFDLIALSVKIIKTRLFQLSQGLTSHSSDPVEVLQHHKSELKKFPRHLSVILSKDRVYYEDLSKLIHWAMALGVEYFSIYDPQHRLQGQREEFEKYVLSHKILPGKITFMEAVARQQEQQRSQNSSQTNNNNPSERNANCDSSELRNRSSANATSNLYEQPPEAPKSLVPNGYERAIRVIYVSESNGKSEIAGLCRKLSERIKDGSLTVDQINIDFVDSRLREEFNQMPDPDLALYTGEFCCTYGFLPWHIRLTEFIPIRHSLILQDFLAVLYKYAKKEQRFGK